jgi:hypothetical protein
MVCEKPDASSAFVDKFYTTPAGEMGKPNSLTGYSLIAKGELASLRQAKAFCQDFPDKLIKRINTMVVELTAEYLHVADDSDATLLQNGQSQRAIYPMNSTKTVPEMGSEGSLMPFPNEHPAAPRSNDQVQAATAASLHPAPNLLRPPVLLGSAPLQQPTAQHVASTDCQQPVEFLRHSTLTFALPPEACIKGQKASDATDAPHHIKDWIQSKVYVLYIVFLLWQFLLLALLLQP